MARVPGFEPVKNILQYSKLWEGRPADADAESEEESKEEASSLISQIDCTTIIPYHSLTQEFIRKNIDAFLRNSNDSVAILQARQHLGSFLARYPDKTDRVMIKWLFNRPKW